MQKFILISVIVVIVIAIVLGLYFILSNPMPKNTLPTDNTSVGNNSPSNNPMAKGLKVEILQQGVGEGAKAGDTVTVNYVGMLTNGTKFDSSIDRNSPFTFPIGKDRVIKGFDNGVLGMKLGEKRRLTIPPELGYGSAKMTLIPANSTLVYDIEMLKIAK